ncbi:hypothetical protein ACNKHQ_13295 [Shigella flexneri]
MKGKSAARIKESFIDRLLVANTHDTILCFSSQWSCLLDEKVYQLPEAGGAHSGRPIVNLLTAGSEKQRITAILPLREYEEGVNVFMATASGTVRRTALTKLAV